jgi:hypothetical protein
MFQKAFSEASWFLWGAVLKAAFGGELTAREQDAIYPVIERETLPNDLRELWMIVGRRGGKDAIAAFIATYIACSRNWKSEFPNGETVVGMIICPDKSQGRVALNYIKAYCDTIPEFKRLVADSLKESISFVNGISIEIHTASYRSTRGYTIPFLILDEIAFFENEDAAEPDSEIIAALRPAMATVKRPLLIAISSPFARKGELYRTFRNHYGREDNHMLVVKGPTQRFNPTVPAEIIEQAFEEDSVKAGSEYGSLENGIVFRSDVEGYVSLEAVQACVVTGRRELARTMGCGYFGFADPSGGSADSFTGAVSHRDRSGMIVLDAIREYKPPFSPEAVTKDLCEFFKAYHVGRVQGDHYGGEWPAEQFRKYGIEYEVCEQNKSEIYSETLPILNSAHVQLLDHPKLIAQLTGLERRTSRSGKDSIDHQPGGHDDVVNAAMGSILMANQGCSVGEVSAAKVSAGVTAQGYSGANGRTMSSALRGGF